MLCDQGLQLSDGLRMTHEFELCSGRDQVINHDVSISSSTNELSATFSSETDARDCTLVERELMGELKSRS